MQKLFVSVFMLLSVTTFAQTADEVIASHLNARGGAEKLAAVKAVKMEATMSAAGMDIPVQTAVVSGVAARTAVSAMGSDIITVIDTTGGWAINPMAGMNDAAKVDLAAVKADIVMLDISEGLLNYASKGSKAELEGKETIGGAEAFKLKLTLKGGQVVTHYIDTKTYNLVKTKRLTNLGGQEFDGEFVYSNHKAIDGVVFAHKQELEHPQFGLMTTTFNKIEVNPTIDSAMFAMPKK